MTRVRWLALVRQRFQVGLTNHLPHLQTNKIKVNQSVLQLSASPDNVCGKNPFMEGDDYSGDKNTFFEEVESKYLLHFM